MLMHHLLYRVAERAPDTVALRWVDRNLALTAEEAVDAPSRRRRANRKPADAPSEDE